MFPVSSKKILISFSKCLSFETTVQFDSETGMQLRVMCIVYCIWVHYSICIMSLCIWVYPDDPRPHLSIMTTGHYVAFVALLTAKALN